MEKNKITVFYSYSHKDELLRDSLETHLSILAKKGIISTWHDRSIVPGCEWEKEIDECIRTADIILLLVSPDFIASEYCYGKELSIAIENHESNKSIVIPVIVRPVDWEDAPFAKLQALPKDALPVTTWPNEDEAWLNVANGIKKAVNEISKKKIREGENAGLLSMRDMLAKEIDRIDVAFNSQSKSICGGLSTGFYDLDEAVDGLHPSQLILIASRPTMGKTNLALAFALNVAAGENQPVAYFSMNLPAQQLTRSLLAMTGNINVNNLLRGSLNDDQWPRVTSAVNLLVDTPLYIDESTVSSIAQLRKRAFDLKESHGLKLIVIDSIQHLIFHGKQSQDSFDERDYSKALKALAKELQIPIVITTSLPRGLEARVNKRPLLHDLSKLHGIEDDSDIVIFIYRDDVYEYDSPDRGLAELIIAKNANGGVGTVRVVYEAEKSRFINYVGDEMSQI